MDLYKFILSLGVGVLLLGAVPVNQGYALTLEECVSLALKNNPDLQKQRLNLKVADDDLVEQKAQNFGRLDMVSSYTHYNLPRTLTPMTPATIASAGSGGVPTTKDLFFTGVIYEVPLFTGFAQTRAVEIAALQKEMVRSVFRLSREQLVYNVRNLYVQILGQQAQKEAQIAYVGALENLYQRVQQEVDLGKKARVDLLKAAADLENARAREEQIRGNITIMRSALATLLGVEEVGDLEELSPSPQPVVALADGPSEDIDNLERLRAARIAVDKSVKQLEKTRSILYPQLVLNTSYGWNYGPNDSTNPNSGDWENQEVWQAGLNLKWNIFDFGTSRARLRRAETVIRQSRYELARTRLELNRSLKEALTRINTAAASYRSAGEELALTRETEKIEQVRYNKGAADINDLLYAKARYQLARGRLIEARYNYASARFYLDYLLEKGENQ
ncbi:TolC family protein [Desulfolithobacter sp.]